MHQTKLIQILAHLDKKETRRFEDFLASPFFNTSEKLLTFYKMLVPHHPRFDSPKLTKERIYKELHRDTAYNDQTMRELISQLFKLAKEFIAHEGLNKKPLKASLIRYEWLNEKGLKKIQEQELAYGNTILREYDRQDPDYYLYDWFVGFNEHRYKGDVMRDHESKLLKDRDFGRHLHALNKYYLVRFLGSYIYMQNLSKIYNTPIAPTVAAHIETLAAGYVGGGDILIDIFYNIYQLHNSGEDRYYYELKSSLLSNDASVIRELKAELSINLGNHCIKKMREGDAKFGQEIVEIYHFVAEHELMLEGGEVPYSFYKNAVTMNSDNDNIEWAEKFAEKYKPMLPGEFRDEAYNFCRAYILFAAGRYDEALRITIELGAFNDFGKLDIKLLTARIQYELSMYDPLYTLMDSLPHYLNRDKVNAARKGAIMHFTGFMKQMIQVNQHYSVQAWEKLQADINEIPAMTNKKWFQQKIAGMKERHNHK